MAGYTRQSTYTDGDVIQASDSNNEFDQLLDAFNNVSGHAHDGTTAEGPVIGLIGDAGLTPPLNKITVDTVNDRLGFFIDVLGASTEQFRVQDGVIAPVTPNDVDLGTSTILFKDGFFAGTVEAVNLEATNIKANDGTAAATIADTTGVMSINNLVATTADVNGGTIDNTTIGATTASSGAFTTITASSTLGVTGNATVGGLVIGTAGSVTDVDTDLTTVSASDDTLASAKAIKTYVDAQVTAQDLDFQADSGGPLNIDLDSEVLTIAGGTGLTTTGLGNTVTVDIDSTVATLTGTQTLTNKTLTSPDINGGSVDGATIDNTNIGGVTPAAITGTTVTATSFVGPLTGQVSDISNHTTTDLAEGTNLYYTQARFDTAFGLKSTTDLTEGTNLYYTTARVNTDFDTRLATKTTTDLTEGTNLYYTTARFDTAFSGKTTTDLTEGTNLYYTTARANTDIDARVTKTYVDGLGVDAATLGGDTKQTILDTAQADALALAIALG